jgi:hypothetical protein
MIVGPQRTGTTWIYQNLRDHPDIMWPRDKELFFFNMLTQPDRELYRSSDLEWYLDQFREPFWMKLVKNFLALRQARRLYRPIVRGEATATYAAMDEALIREVTVLNPDIRAIMMLRNPIERAWSHAKKDLARDRNRKMSDVDDGEFEAFFSSEYQRKCARYKENYAKWERLLKPGHLMLARFDDITSRPLELLGEICEFLGVDTDQSCFSDSASEAVNQTEPTPIPSRYRTYLDSLFRDDIRDIEQTFGVSWK